MRPRARLGCARLRRHDEGFHRTTILQQIKRAVLAGNIVFTEKAVSERELDGLTEQDVIESIVNAVAIYKTVRSRNPVSRKRERLHIIQSTNLQGVVIYTKGKLVVASGIATYHVLVSAKRSQ